MDLSEGVGYSMEYTDANSLGKHIGMNPYEWAELKKVSALYGTGGQLKKDAIWAKALSVPCLTFTKYCGRKMLSRGTQRKTAEDKLTASRRNSLLLPPASLKHLSAP